MRRLVFVFGTLVFKTLVVMLSSILFLRLESNAFQAYRSKFDLDDDCPCRSHRRGGCFKPVCPAGYYQCCFGCELNGCNVGDDITRNEMHMSLRGELECLPCRSGDYCPGCDEYMECPSQSRISYYDQKAYEIPTISKPKTPVVHQCQKCPSDSEPDLARERCVVEGWRSDCVMEELITCMERCRETPWYYGFGEEEQEEDCVALECRMKCALDNSDKECHTAHKGICERMNMKLHPVGMSSREDELPLAEKEASFYHPSLGPALLSADSSLAELAELRRKNPCKVPCGGSVGMAQIFFDVMVIFIVMLM